MADNNMNKTPNNEAIQNEQAKASVGGNDRKTEEFKLGGDRKPEQAGTDKNRQSEASHEKSAIGGGEHKDGKSQTTGQSSQSDKSRTEPASR